MGITLLKGYGQTVAGGISCHAPGSTPPKPIPVGFALVTHAQTTSGAPSYVWRTDEFHVPAQLDGAGFTARFLDALVTELRRRTPSASLEVTVSDNSAGTDTGSRKNHVQLIEFYKSRKFVLQPPPQHQKLVFAG